MDTDKVTCFLSVLADGGGLWKNRPGSPGRTIVIPNSTPFAIKMDGPCSNNLILGVCQDGRYLVREGEYAGVAFESASAAVNTVRKISTNAFLYVELKMNGKWLKADDVRRMPEHTLSPEADLAFDALVEFIRNKRKSRGRKFANEAEHMAAAVKLLSERPEVLKTFWPLDLDDVA